MLTMAAQERFLESNNMDKKTLIIMNQDDIDEFKQLLDLIYTELSEFNDTVRQQLDPEEDDDV
mgnify:CR=1 FL=1|jgi:hypothetical protein|tara:strand:+ start:99 stop:287 length:189 start_codon:yes stop_codon:yes gene_type:complete